MNTSSIEYSASTSYDECDLWMPEVLKTIFDEGMQVIYYNEIDKNDIRDTLKSSKQVGLTLIFKDASQMIFKACLTTHSIIYVLDPSDEIQKSFLERQLTRNKFKFYCANGARDAKILFNNLGITLKNQIDLVAYDIQLNLLKKFVMGPPPMKKAYSFTDIQQIFKPKTQDYDGLVSNWITPDLDLVVDQRQTSSIWTRPHCIQAQNAIIKRAGLVRAIALAMLEANQHMERYPSTLVYSLGVRAPDDVRDEFDHRGLVSYHDLIAFLSRCPAHSDVGSELSS